MAGALHAKRVSSSWKDQRFHVKSQRRGLPKAQLPHLFKRVLGSWDTWQERGANSTGCHEDNERPLRSWSGATDHWSRSTMGRRNNTNHEAVRTEVGRWRPHGKQQILSPLDCR